jgi:hypothetical protein
MNITSILSQSLPCLAKAQADRTDLIGIRKRGDRKEALKDIQVFLL